jgi:hypothetical protein
VYTPEDASAELEVTVALAGTEAPFAGEVSAPVGAVFSTTTVRLPVVVALAATSVAVPVYYLLPAAIVPFAVSAALR